MTWRFLFFELTGNGTETFIKGDVKVSNPQPIRKLSSPHQISGVLTPESRDMLEADGATILKRRKTTVYVADEHDKIWVGGILADFDIDGPNLTIDVAGFTYIPKDEPYDGDYTGVGVDPLDLVRMLWAHQQNKPGGNLGLRVDATTSPVRIGEPPRQVEFNAEGQPVSFEADDRSVRLNWWTTLDMGGQIDTWAKDTPFDYIEDHVWNGDVVEHYLRLGYPTIGSRKVEPRFVLGENVTVIPGEDYSGDDVVTEVWVFGAGEGKDRIRGVASIYPESSLRRVKQVHDKKITSTAEATARAHDILMSYQPDIPGAGITQLRVKQHSNADFGSFDVGDEICYSGEHYWGDVLIWVRIVAIQLDPSGDLILTVIRSDTLKT